MNKRLRALHKIFSVISGISLVFNSLVPASLISILVAPRAYAQETPSPTPDPTPTDTPIPTDTPTLSPTPTDTVTPTPDPTPTIIETPTVTLTPTEEATPSPTPQELTPTPTEVAQPTETGPPETPAQEQGQILDGVSTVAPTPAETATPTPTITPEEPEQGQLAAQILDNVKADTLNLDSVDPSTSASISTDKADYAPTDTAIISGTGFKSNHTYNLTVKSDDPPATSTTVEIKTDDQGAFVYAYQLDGTYRPNYSVTVTNQSGKVLATTTFTDGSPSVDLDQCRNGAYGSPVTCTGSAWVNGNAGKENSHYFEGDSIVYRARFDNLSIGTHWLTIEWDTTKSGKHAIDYLTTFNRTETTADPCSGVTGCGSPATFAIPADPNITGFTPIAGNFTIYNGTINSVSVYTLTGTYADNSSTKITINFTASAANPVLAWGGHIATRSDWGANNSAVDISGSPYHTRLDSFSDGNVGQQDRSLSADAVIFPASITIIKNATPDGSTSFPFTASPSPLSNFSLVDDGTSTNTHVFSNITNFQKYTVAETVPSTWTLKSIVCTVTSPNGGSQTPSNPSVEIDLKEGENVTCTFADEQQAAHLIVIKHVTNDNGGTAAAGDFSMTINGVTATGGNTFSGEESPGTDKIVSTGSYSVTETGPNGYSASYSSDCTGTISAGQTKTCTVTNNDNEPALHLRKTVTNDNGGTALVSAWTLSATGTAVSPTNLSGKTPVDSGMGFKADTYALAETGGPSGYTAGTWNCGSAAMPDATHVTVPLGGNVTCTINNDDNAPALHLRKVVVNDDGGTSEATAWTLSASGPTPLSGTTPVDSGVSFDQGTYTLSESGPSGYTASAWNCVGGSQSGNAVTVSLGESATCTITNDDIAPTLKLVKVVTNDNGGNKTSADWTLRATGTGGFSDTGNSTTFHPVKANVSYGLSESTVAGYDAGTFSCDGGTLVGQNLTLGLDSDVTCTITNNDQAAHLIVIKHVDNGTTGATTTADAFTMTINGVTASGGNSFSGSETGTNKTLTTVGSYSVTESGPSGYTDSYSADCLGTIALGETKTCTITNTAIAPQLKLVKTVTNDNGGTKTVNDFVLKVDGSTVISGDFNTFTVGAHTASEINLTGYTASDWGGDCEPNGAVTLALADSKTCTITNNDNAPALHLRKIVVNDNGGNAKDTDWTLSASGPTPLSGTTPVDSGVSFDQGAYTLSESGPSDYTASSWTCVGGTQNGSTITVGLGESATCTITNDDKPAHLIVIKHVINDNGGTKDASDFSTTISGVTTATPTAPGAESPGVDNILTTVGPYSVDEGAHAGYDKSLSEDCSGTIALGETKTCTITNSDIQPKLTLTKIVKNDNGGNAVISDFPLFVDDTPVTSGVQNGFDAGTYTASETNLGGYTASAWSPDCAPNGSITLAVGDVKSCNIVNDDQPAHIVLTKVVNNNHGGTASANDFGISIDGGSVQSGSTTDVTSNTPHTLDETGLTGYEFVSLTGDAKCPSVLGGEVTLNEGETVRCTITNEDISPTLRVKKVLFPGTDPGKFNLQIDGSTAGTGANVGDGGTTGVINVDAGRHTVGETAGTGTLLENYTRVIGGDCGSDGTITLAPGANKTCTITNTRKTGELIVYKIADTNGDGQYDEYDPSEFKWGTESAQLAATNMGSGQTLITGNYNVYENDVPGYTLTGWFYGNPDNSDFSCREPEYTGLPADIAVTEDHETEITLCNQLQNPVLTITKENNTGGANKSPSDNVLFTITVTATQSAAYNVHVTDLPAGGFVPRDGTYTAVSSVRGDILGLTGNPGYHSPGVWNLGNMIVGEKVTLTYIADIVGNEQPGLYYDLAWAAGCRTNTSCSDVLANAVNPGFVTDNYVGTTVRILTDQQNGAEVKVIGEVLGASTELPATGANQFWLLVAFGLITGGLTLGALGWFLRRKYA